MGISVKPVFILSRGAGVFTNQDGRMEVVLDGDANRNRINELLQELGSEAGDRVTIREELLVSDPADFESLSEARDEIDVILAYFLGVTPIEGLLGWSGPIIAFSGQYTPAMALYAVGAERWQREDLFIALDYKDIRRMLRVLEVKKSLAETRIVLFGFPPSWHLRWYVFPDLEAVRRRLGVQFIPVELRELIELVQNVAPDEAALVANSWMGRAEQVIEPTEKHLQESAAVYLAMRQVMERTGARAMAINCLEIAQSRKFAGQIINPCMGMLHLRDQGLPSGCEMDIPGLLTMILLGSLSQKPAFLGNVVHADPVSNTIKLSHCILPTRMHGFDKDPLPYLLRDYHGLRGVTAFTRVPSGLTVTLARADRNLERMVALTGKILAGEDTTFCRNTLSIQVHNVRDFVQQAEGNHHALVFGDYLDDMQTLCALLDCDFQEV